jgi:hypothetical protein
MKKVKHSEQLINIRVQDLDFSALRNTGVDEVTSGDVFQDLHTMHQKFGFHDHEMTLERLEQRLNFIQEELDETRLAMKSGDAEGVVDGLIDIGVVQVGTIDLLNVRFWKAWNEVYIANMAKKFGMNPSRPDSKGLDLYKPEGWKVPSHYRNTGILEKILVQPPPPRHSMTLLETIMESQIAIPLDISFKDISEIPEMGLSMIESMFERLKQIRVDKEPSDLIDDLQARLQSFIHNVSAMAAYVENQIMKSDTTSINVLKECIEIQKRKTADYQAIESDVTQADYYPNGISDIIYMLHLKMTRVRSLVQKMIRGGKPENESIADTMRDSINYATFAISWIQGKLEGQNPKHDIFNQFINE